MGPSGNTYTNGPFGVKIDIHINIMSLNINTWNVRRVFVSVLIITG